MDYAFANRIRVLTSTHGTGTLTLGAALIDMQAFAGNVPDGSAVTYTIEDGPLAWECGSGTYHAGVSGNADTLTRDTVEASSAGGAKIALSGNANVYITPTASWLTSLQERVGTVLVQDTPPVGAHVNTLWWDSANTGLYVNYNDGNSTQWVVAENQNTLSDAPVDGHTYGRQNATWLNLAGGAGIGGPFLPTAGGTMTGALNVTATGGNTVRSVQDRFADVVNVRDYGAKGDGTTNDTAAFNAAMSDAEYSPARTVMIPTGLYLLDPLNLPNGVVLQGAVPGPIDPPGSVVFSNPANALGATLLVNSHGSPFITLNVSSGLRDVMIYDPGQVAPTATAPNVFPETILMQRVSRISGVTICNAYDGIFVRSGRCWVENCYIGAYHTCVDTDTAADVIYYNNIWCGVFYDTCVGLGPWQNMDYWVINNNGVAFKFGRADAVSMVNCGHFIKWCGVYIIDGSQGQTYGWCINYNADCCVYGAIVESTNAAVGWNFVNFSALNTAGPSTYPQSISPLLLQSGGVSAPHVNWTGGSIGVPGTPGFWTSPTPIVNAGWLQVSNVNSLTDAVITPHMDGTAAVGNSLALARADHVHPSDTSRLATSGGTVTGNLVMANAQWLEFADASGGVSQMAVDGGNNLFWYGSNASGAPRIMMSISMHSSTSILGWSVPVQFVSTVGFNNTAPIAKPTVTGAKGGNTALASLLIALAAYGLVTDSSTA